MASQTRLLLKQSTYRFPSSRLPALSFVRSYARGRSSPADEDNQVDGTFGGGGGGSGGGGGGGGIGQDIKFGAWLSQIGEQYRHIKAPRKWLGGKVPFPMNPTFNPPAPVSDKMKQFLYAKYMSDPKANSVRKLSQQFNVSMKRLDAILRLKGMEDDWRKNGKVLQTGFAAGMEAILGVTTPQKVERHLGQSSRENTQAEDTTDPSRTEGPVYEADLLEEDEQRDAARQRYQYLYWESVPEDGREPIIPGSIEHAKLMSKLHQTKKERSKMHLPLIKDTEFIKTPRQRIQVVERPGRPTMVFIDVGGKYMDFEAEAKRAVAADHRASLKEKRRLKSRRRL